MASRKSRNIYIPKYFMVVKNCINIFFFSLIKAVRSRWMTERCTASQIGAALLSFAGDARLWVFGLYSTAVCT